MENNKTLKTVIITALISVLLTNTVRDIIYVQKNGKINNKVSAISRLITKNSLFEADEEKLADYAAKGLADAVDDQYTNYYSKEEFVSYIDNLSNSFLGIGIVISVDETADKLIVVSPFDGGPAAASGILPGDYIVAVDDVEYTSKDMSEAVTVLRGDRLPERKGTKVRVTVEREGQRLDFIITRDIVRMDSVQEKMIDDEIGYIKISAFNSKDTNDPESKDTFDEFTESIDKLTESGYKKLIIDLRNNPGGSLDVVLKIADKLLPAGIITYTENKSGKREDFTSDPDELNIPIAILVNGASASASEVLTGAMKDYKKATVIGTKTFGKGIVQTLYPLSDGSGMTVTTARYYSPNGVCIHGIGIEPDIVVEIDESKPLAQISPDEDPQLVKAIEVLK